MKSVKCKIFGRGAGAGLSALRNFTFFILHFTLAILPAWGEGYKRDCTHALPMRGVVSWIRTGAGETYFFLYADDGSGSWRIDCNPAKPHFTMGDIVEVVSGESKSTFTTPRINRAECRLLGHDDSKLPVPLKVSVADLYVHPLNEPCARDRWGDIVVAEGIVRDINRRETYTQLQVSDGERSFQAPLNIHIDNSLPEDLKLGASVRVEGVMVYTAVDDLEKHVMTDFHTVSVLPPSLQYVTILSKPPFWTPAKLWGVIGGFVAALLAALVWAAMLRRAVAKKTEQLETTIREKVRDKVEADAIRRERLRFSYELHDNFQQLLASCRFRLETLDLMLPEDATAERAQLEKAQTALDYTQSGLRTALWGMTEESEGPKTFTGLLEFAMKRMAHWEGVVFLSVEGIEPPGARKFAGLLLMVLQEAVGNALKHGGATRVDVKLAFEEETLAMAISDNGCGFDASKPFGTDHLGLSGMKMRVASCGGTLSIESAPGRGTAVSVRVLYED